MALLERVNAMKEQGLSETEIFNALKDAGNTPEEIANALSQARIKAAVAQTSAPEEYPPGDMTGMQPSIMAGVEQPAAIMAEEPLARPSAKMPAAPVQTPMQTIAQQTMAPAAYEQYQYPQYAAEAAYPAEAQYPQEYAYAPETAGYYQQALDLETVRDISKQQVDEALRKIREDLLAISKIKTEMNFEIQDMQNRLSKIESQMGEIQAAIIRKIGEYGESISSISKEIQATQQSFSKVINPLMDKTRGISRVQPMPVKEEIQKPAPKKQEKKAPRVSQADSSSPSFEDYFR